MTDRNRIVRAVPTLAINNRKHNLLFYTQVMGMTNLLEDAGFTSLGDKTRLEKLILEEVPSNRARKVEGPKKLKKICIKVANPREIDSLLATEQKGVTFYKGEHGFAFEALSPEGDCFLLHSEDTLDTLVAVASIEDIEPLEDFQGLTEFEVESLQLNVSALSKADFYQNLAGSSDFLAFEEASGADLDIEARKTWDLAAIHWMVDSIDVADLEQQFVGKENFVPKSRKFFVTKDESQIEVWVESV
ncbi:CppA N-terminal domain-containing protein [Streptococcus pneumoniae]